MNTIDPGIGFDDPEIQDTPSQVLGDFAVTNDLGALNQSMLVGGTAAGIPLGATDNVTWSFDGLTAGEYELLTTWVSIADAATNTTFRVDGLLTVQVDQSVAPDGPIVAGSAWQSLGRFFSGGGTTLDVELRGEGADGYVVADAVRLVRVGELPEFSPLPDVTIQESDLLSVPLTVTYPLGALGDIDLALRDDAPAGVMLADPTISAGQLQATILWPASAARETGSFLISIVAIDREHPSRRVEEAFWATIGSPNSPPSLTSQPSRTVLQGDLVTTRFVATDADGPYWELQYSLGVGSPSEASIDPETGWFSWDTANASVGTHTIEVIVTDRGNAPLSDQFDWSVELVHSGAAATLQAPVSQTIMEDSSLVLSTLLNNGVSLIGTGDEIATLGIVASDGRVQLSPAQGLTYELGATQPTSHVKVRGTVDDLNVALDQLTFYPNTDFRGQTVLRVELTDAGNVVRAPSLQLAEIPITVTADVDAPTILDQVLFFSPDTTAGALQVVGTVRAQDPDPDQLLSFRLVSATADFAIDAGTGRVVAANDAVLPSGEVELVVQAFYELSPTAAGQGVVTIHRVPDANSDPTIRNDNYSLQEDQFVSGNFLLGDTAGGFADYDSNGDAITLVSVTDWQDRPIAFDVPHRVPSGATMLVSADGSFTFDASTSDAFDAGYYGASQEELYYVIADEHGATKTGGRINFTVHHVNDVHTVDNQGFTANPAATTGDRVGQLVVANAEPTELLDFAIVSGNTGSAFAIDYATGEIAVNSPASLSLGQSFNLVVEVADWDFNVVSAVVSVAVTQNLPPVVPDAHFLTAVDLPLSGNVFTDLTGNGAAFDPDGGILEIATLEGSAYKLGRTAQLSSGAALTVNSDGSFSYDPSTSTELQRLSADETRTERIEFTARDDDGTAVSALLVITVGGRNWAPRAFDNLYLMSNDEQLAGNLIHDFGTSNLRDTDENSDELTVVEADGIAFQTDLAFTSRRGAAVLVSLDGTLQYDPAGMDLTGLAAGDRVYDAFTYQIADEFGRTALAVTRIEVTISDLDISRYWIADLGLANDTSTQGDTGDDDRSEDPRLSGTVAGWVAGVVHFEIQFDLHAIHPSGQLQTGSELVIDATLNLPPTAQSFPSFEFDPSTVTPFGTHGDKTIAYRVVGFDQVGNSLGASTWDYYQFEWLRAIDNGPIRLNAIRLFHDTATVDVNGNPAGHDDNITTDPRIYALVAGDFDDPPLTGNDTRTVRIEFEHTRNATVFTDEVSLDMAQSVVYDPRVIDAGLAEDFSGTLVVNYIADVIENIGGNVTQTQFAAGNIEFYYFSVPSSCGIVTLAEVPPPAGGYRGSTRDITGTAFGNCSPNGAQAYVEFDYADINGNFDDAPDGDVAVIIDSTGSTAQADFEYTAIGLAGAQPLIRARVKDWNSEHSAFQYGDWSAPLQLSAVMPPGIASATLGYQSVDGRELTSVSGYLVGSIDDNTSGQPHDLGSVAFIGLEFFHRDPSDFVFSSAWPVAGTSITDAVGRFEYSPTGLDYDRFYRIWARTVITLSDGSTAYGDAMYAAPDAYVASPALPTVELLELFDPNAAVFTAGRWRTTDTRIVGSVVQYNTPGVDVDAVDIEFAHDYVGSVGDEDVVAGIATVESDGSFSYAPTLTPGDVNVRARVSYFDPLTVTRLVSAWHYDELQLAVDVRMNVPVVVDTFQLTNPIAGTTNPAHVVRPTVSGHITNPDGYVDFVEVQFRDATTLNLIGTTQTNADGSFLYTFDGLTPGPISVDARALDWDYVNQQLVPGPWTSGSSSLSFILDPRVANEIATFALLSDTGPVSGQTANPALFGTVSGDGPYDLLAIAIDHDDDGTVDATVHPDASGAFYYFPDALPYGLQTFRGMVATWCADLSVFEFSTGATTTFTLESQANGAAQFAAIGLAHPARPFRTPRLSAASSMNTYWMVSPSTLILMPTMRTVSTRRRPPTSTGGLLSFRR